MRDPGIQTRDKGKGITLGSPSGEGVQAPTPQWPRPPLHLAGQATRTPAPEPPDATADEGTVMFDQDPKVSEVDMDTEFVSG